MKKLLFAFVALIVSLTTLSAKSRMIDETQLPKNAQTFIATHFAGDKVNIATEERDGVGKEYKVILKSGNTLEFNTKGNWTDVKCKGGVPEAILPDKIKSFVKAKFPSNHIVNAEQDSRGWIEVELNNGVDLEFNAKGDLVEAS